MKKKMSIFFLVFLFFLSLTHAQQPGEISYKDTSVMPPGRIGERIQSLIAVLNAEDPDKIQQFLKSDCTANFQRFVPVQQHIDVFLNVLFETGGLDFHSVRTYVPERKNETVVILKDRNLGSWRSIVLEFDKKDADRINAIQFGTARPPSNVTVPPLTETGLVDTLKELFRNLKEKNAFSGTFLVAKGNKVLVTGTAGEASKRFHVPNNIDTKFNLGSMNKMFTSVSIVQLVEKGEISYDDSIDKYIDESWLPKEVTSRITIHHLLTHTSGLGSYFNRTFMRGSRENWREVNDYKELIKDEKPAFTPGTRFRYSNTGMFLLGVVIEKVTGRSYFDYIRDHIYKPARMTHSDSYEMDYPVENLAIGYIPNRKSPYGWKNNIFQHVIKGGPAGGGFSTVKDLYMFAQALTTGKFVSKESLERMWTDHAKAGYGYGFTLQEVEDDTIVGHSGGFPGINANLDIYLKKGYIVAVMSNYSNGARPLQNKIRELISRIK